MILTHGAFRDDHVSYLVEDLRECGGTTLVACDSDHTVAVCGVLRAKATNGGSLLTS